MRSIQELAMYWIIIVVFGALIFDKCPMLYTLWIVCTLGGGLYIVDKQLESIDMSRDASVENEQIIVE